MTENAVAAKNATTYSKVHTYDVAGNIVDERVIDLSVTGARRWLMNHHWWALNHGNMVGLTLATKDEHDRYQLERLAQKFNKAS